MVLLRVTDKWMVIRGEQIRRRSKVTATETASRMNSEHKRIGPSGVRILSQNKSMPAVNNQDLYKRHAKDMRVHWSCCKTPDWEKLPLVSWLIKTNNSPKTNSIYCIDGKGVQAFRADLSSVKYNVNSIINMFPDLLSSYIIHRAYGKKNKTLQLERTISKLDLTVTLYHISARL